MSFQYLRDENRIGQFSIHVSHLFEDYTKQLLSACIIVKAERTFRMGDSIEYTAFHPDFFPAKDYAAQEIYTPYVRSDGVAIFGKNETSRYPSTWIILNERKRDSSKSS